MIAAVPRKQAALTAEGVQRPRVVVVTRATGLDRLVEKQGTKGQAEFFLKARGQSIATLELGHQRFHDNLGHVVASLPADQRRAHVDRAELDRFVFAPDDIILVVGQDGLVPNAAKYLSGQLVIGVNPDPGEYDGVLCRHPPAAVAGLLAWAEEWLSTGGVAAGCYAVERRSMAVAVRDDGLELAALNELFVGHASHQSARYRLELAGERERQSSSGVICSTGTGATGWARSIALQRGLAEPLPAPVDPALLWLVREPFPSVATGTSLTLGRLGPGESLRLVSEMGEGGVVFADGIEHDYLELLAGRYVDLRLAGQTLNLVVPAAT